MNLCRASIIAPVLLIGCSWAAAPAIASDQEPPTAESSGIVDPLPSAVDGEGHICVATLITGAVSDIWPDGSRVDQFMLPDMMVTNVCFGGRDLRTAFATLSMGGTLVSFEWPRPGLALKHLNRP